jgi:hypothetical protein
LSTLWARQVHNQKLSERFALAISHFDLADGVGTTRGIVSSRAVSSARRMPIINYVEHLFLAFSLALLEAWNLDLTVCILLDDELLFTIEQIKELATINLKERHVERTITITRIEDIMHRSLRCIRNRVRLSRASLTISE